MYTHFIVLIERLISGENALLQLERLFCGNILVFGLIGLTVTSIIVISVDTSSSPSCCLKSEEKGSQTQFCTFLIQIP